MLNTHFAAPIKFEWSLGEAAWLRYDPWAVDAQWTTADRSLAASPDNQRTDSRELRVIIASLRSVLILAAMFFLVAATGPSTDQVAQRRIRDELSAVLSMELSAIQTENLNLYFSLMKNGQPMFESSSWLDPLRIRSRERHRLSFALLDVDTQPELLLARVQIDPPRSHWIPTAYEEVRFYEHIEGKWQRIEPPIQYWGEIQQWETDHFRYQFRAKDRAAVFRAAEEVENLAHRIGQAISHAPVSGRKLAFLVEPRAALELTSSKWELPLTSPTLYRLPAGISSEEQLLNSISGHLVNRALARSLNVKELFELRQWYNVVSGVRSWTLTEIVGRPPYWRPAGHQLLCQAHHEVPGFQLSDLTESGQLDRNQRVLKAAAAETFITYALHTYGEDKLSLLLETFQVTDSWESLVGDVFGASIGEITSGWNRYLGEVVCTE